MKVLVCGGRTYENEKKVNETLDLIHFLVGISVVVHGDAGKFYDAPDYAYVPDAELPGWWAGADKLAAHWAHVQGVAEKFYKPNWKEYGRKAGPFRNQTMLDTEKPDVVIAFPGGKGTADMVKRAKVGGYKVFEVGQ